MKKTISEWDSLFFRIAAVIIVALALYMIGVEVVMWRSVGFTFSGLFVCFLSVAVIALLFLARDKIKQ